MSDTPVRTSGVAIAPLGLSLSIFLALSFLLCTIGGLIPGIREIHFLSALYPWIDWSKPQLVLLGVVWAFAAGWYVALVWGFLYNLFAGRRR